MLRVAILSTSQPHRLSQPRSCASQSEGAAELVLPPLRFDKPLQRGAVHFVSTPIGNLEDITLRALRTLREADVIATEDPKVTAPLLRRLGIERKELPLVTHNDNNLERSVPKLVEYAEQGLLVAVVSDAGTPAISDPGLGLAAACAKREVLNPNRNPNPNRNRNPNPSPNPNPNPSPNPNPNPNPVGSS